MDALAIGVYDFTVRDLADGVALKDCLGIAWEKAVEMARGAQFRGYFAGSGPQKLYRLRWKQLVIP